MIRTADLLRRPRRRRDPRRAQRGQVLVLFALGAVVVVAMVGVAIDGGYGLVQMRRAQNAADFSAVAGTNAVKSVCQGNSLAPTNASVYNSIQDVIDQNSAAVNAGWTGTYLDSGGNVILKNGAPFTVTNTTDFPPANACGVTVKVTPSWQPFLAQVMGVSNMTSTATAKSVLNPATGKPIAIVALNTVMPHEVLGGGTGTFTVFGTIFANSTVPYGPWNQNKNGVVYDDVVDAKDYSNLVLHGYMTTAGTNWPLDWCFGDASSPSPPNNALPVPATGTHSPDPWNTATCNGGSGSQTVTLRYDYVKSGQSQIPDPLLPVGGVGGVPNPWTASSPTYTASSNGVCPGQSSAPVFTSTPAAVNGTTTLLPGEYTSPVVITSGNVVLTDCGNVLQTNLATNQYPGIFRFDKGLAILTPAGTTVQGNNVMIATSAPVAVPGNVPGSVVSGSFVGSGSGNGAPCYPTSVTTTSNVSETDSGSPSCGGVNSSAPAPFGSLFATQYKGVTLLNQSTFKADNPAKYGTGTNFGLILGGAGTITLNPPNSGVYSGIQLFQDRNVPANFGFDAYPGDSATVTVTGVVYNGSLPCNGMPTVNGACATGANLPQPNPFDYWDVGIVFSAGGMLQAGVGTGTGYPNTSTGTVTINGPCVVEDFNTDGKTVITIDGSRNTYSLPGVVGSGNPPLVG